MQQLWYDNNDSFSSKEIAIALWDLLNNIYKTNNNNIFIHTL